MLKSQYIILSFVKKTITKGFSRQNYSKKKQPLCENILTTPLIPKIMIARALAFVLVLTVVQLGQGIAIKFEVAPADLARPVHIGLGVLTTIVVLGLTRSMRQQKHPVAGDATFLLLLLIFQGLAGVFILAEVEVSVLIHLVLSFFVVAAAAANLVLSLTELQRV